jgi:hypothetical protein
MTHASWSMPARSQQRTHELHSPSPPRRTGRAPPCCVGARWADWRVPCRPARPCPALVLVLHQPVLDRRYNAFPHSFHRLPREAPGSVPLPPTGDGLEDLGIQPSRVGTGGLSHRLTAAQSKPWPWLAMRVSVLDDANPVTSGAAAFRGTEVAQCGSGEEKVGVTVTATATTGWLGTPPCSTRVASLPHSLPWCLTLAAVETPMARLGLKFQSCRRRNMFAALPRFETSLHSTGCV